MSDIIQQTIQQTTKLIDLTEKKLATLRELRRALALREFIPSAFEGSETATTTITGSLHPTWTLHKKSGEDVSFPLQQVPRDVLRPDQAEIYDRLVQAIRRKGEYAR